MVLAIKLDVLLLLGANTSVLHGILSGQWLKVLTVQIPKAHGEIITNLGQQPVCVMTCLHSDMPHSQFRHWFWTHHRFLNFERERVLCNMVPAEMVLQYQVQRSLHQSHSDPCKSFSGREEFERQCIGHRIQFTFQKICLPINQDMLFVSRGIEWVSLQKM